MSDLIPYGEQFEKIVDIMKNNQSLINAHLQLQLHKFIWNPNQKGV